MPLKHIASYLWITPQSLSRIRAKLGKKKGGPEKVRGFPIRTQTASLRPAAPKKRFPAPGAEPDNKRPEATIRP